MLRADPLRQLLEEAVALHRGGDLAAAERLYRRVLKLDSANADALMLMGCIAYVRGDFAESDKLLSRSLKSNSRFVDAFANRAAARLALGRAQDGLADADRALELAPNHAGALVNRAKALVALEQLPAALESVEQALRINPSLAEAWSNKSVCLLRLGEHVAAFDAALRAVERDPALADGWCNLSLAALTLGDADRGLAYAEHALERAPQHPHAWYVKGLALQERGRHTEAVECFERTGKARFVGDRGAKLTALADCCLWTNFDRESAQLEREIRAGLLASAPFQALSFSDDPQLHWLMAARVAQGVTAKAHQFDPSDFAPGKIKVALLSADFRAHPTTFLLLQSLSRLDKSRFELVGLSIGSHPGLEAFEQIKSLFDEFHDIAPLDNDQVIALLRERRVELLIDLMGHTKLNRFTIMAGRATPVQVNYLGYPGTIGANYCDYVILDPVIADGIEPHFSERAVLLPHCYQPANPPNIPEDPTLSRAAEGLPQDAFVFVCFCNNWKINPTTFSTWMEILSAVPGSVLWLLANNDDVKANLRREAAARKVDPDRLVFAARAPHARHLARQRLGDLFLDTFPYGAHTTASDALRAGLPIISRAGASFPSRVAKSILSAAGLPDLAVSSEAEYRDLAIHYATTPGAIDALKARVRANWSAPMFDPDLYARHFELALLEMSRRWRAGEPPTRLDVRDLL